jgi:predicted nucleic acid-binding protein
VREFLMARFPDPLLRMSPASYREFIGSLPAREVSGGAAYDALVAAVAAEHRCELVTCDRRAVPVYERYAVKISLL